MDNIKEALNVAKDYINLLKEEKKELIEFRNILEEKLRKKDDELLKIKTSAALLRIEVDELKVALKHKEALKPDQKLSLRTNEEIVRLTEAYKKCRKENKQLQEEKNSLIQKIHLKRD